jgi:hypothetical protein
LICDIATPLVGGDIITMNGGAVIDQATGLPFSAAAFTVSAATTLSVTGTTLDVGGNDFLVTFNEPVSTASLGGGNVVLSGHGSAFFTGNNGGPLSNELYPTNPTSALFHVAAGPIASLETLTIKSGPTGVVDATPGTPKQMAGNVVVTASPDNTGLSVASTLHQYLFTQASLTIDNIHITAKAGTVADGVNGNNFKVATVAPAGSVGTGAESTTIVAGPSATACGGITAVQFCVTISADSTLSPAGLTNKLASDATFSSVFVGTSTGAFAGGAGPTFMAGGSTIAAAVVILNKPIDLLAGAGPNVYGTYTLDVTGTGSPAPIAAIPIGIGGHGVLAIDNAAGPVIIVAVFSLPATTPLLSPGARLMVVTPPADFALHNLGVASINIS